MRREEIENLELKSRSVDRFLLFEQNEPNDGNSGEELQISQFATNDIISILRQQIQIRDLNRAKSST